MKLYILGGPDGKHPVRTDSVEEWGTMMESDERIVGHTEIGPVRISTVFLGLDHGFFGPEAILFESMVFDQDGPCEQDRYSNWAAAEAGHAALVRRYVEGVKSADSLLADTLGSK